MIDLEYLQWSGFFKELILSAWEVLFSEWDVDPHIYLIYDGELIVKKSVATNINAFKTLWTITKWNIVWEWALNHEEKKEVHIEANKKTKLLKIDGKKDFPQFMAEKPKEAYSLLMSIIHLANTRLLEANREITANYEVSLAISHIQEINLLSITRLLETFIPILWVERILYFEKNQAVEWYYKLQYDSKKSSNIENNIFTIQDIKEAHAEIESQWIQLTRFTRITPLPLGKKNYWYIMIGREKNDFHENEEKLLTNTAMSFVSIIHQKEILDATRNKSYIKNN